MSIELIDTVDFPEYALCGLINDDTSGMDNSDIQELDDWAEAYPNATFSIKDEEASFCSSPEFGLPCNCVELEIYQ